MPRGGLSGHLFGVKRIINEAVKKRSGGVVEGREGW
jgi:hypothetical protein